MAGGRAGQRLVGRDRQLGELEAALREAVAGHGALALVTGEAGIGKSRLAAELAARAPAHGARLVWASCWDGGGAPAYWPWVQALRGGVARRAPAEVAEDLGPGAGEVLRLAPDGRPAPSAPGTACRPSGRAAGRARTRSARWWAAPPGRAPPRWPARTGA
jgi:eukaryotic-like serine/threonine-protein kinase